MASTVYFYDDVSRLREGAADCFRIIAKDYGKGKVALKVHFGEEGNTTHVKAEWLRDAASILGGPVFIECNVLYRGSRTVREDHLKMAAKHGFGFLPLDILDGETGGEYVEVPVNAGRTGAAKLGAGIVKYGRLVAVSHFKGHMATSFGGALKNIGMGLGSRAGKMDMHAVISPVVSAGKCVACGTCVGDCPVNAISLGGVASIDSGRCIGCAHCIAVCPQAAIGIPWDMSHEVNRILMEKIAEYAFASMKGRRWWFVNFLTDVTPDCDCLPGVQKPLLEDVGILLSQDPVAVDQASLDLVKKKNKGVDPFLERHGIDGSHMLEYAEKLGLGSREYVLNRIGVDSA